MIVIPIYPNYCNVRFRILMLKQLTRKARQWFFVYDATTPIAAVINRKTPDAMSITKTYTFMLIIVRNEFSIAKAPSVNIATATAQNNLIKLNESYYVD